MSKIKDLTRKLLGTKKSDSYYYGYGYGGYGDYGYNSYGGYGYGGYGYGGYGYGGKYGYRYRNTKIHESIKTLRSNIQFAGIDNPIKTIAVSSSVPSEGKSTISYFLSIEMAKAGNKTLIVECDLRRPTQANLFKLRPKLGLTKYLSGECTLEEAASPTNTENLYFLDVDAKVVNPVELLGSEKFKNAMAEMKEKFDIVIFDTLPLSQFIEGALIAANTDATIMVIRAGRVPAKQIKSCIEQLDKANANIIGAVLNDVDDKKGFGYYNYYSKYRKYSNSYKNGYGDYYGYNGKYSYDDYYSYVTDDGRERETVDIKSEPKKDAKAEKKSENDKK